jgi:hypothetical protein
MAIQVGKNDLAKRAQLGLASIQLPAQKRNTEPAPALPSIDTTALSGAIAQIGEALALARNEQRAELLRAIAVNEEIATVLVALRNPAIINVDVHIVRRDVIGRILDVQFRTPKP